MRERTCYIVGAAPDAYVDFAPQAGDFVIAADGGYAYLERLGIRPDVALGDFDSLEYSPGHANMVTYPKEKDDTDMMLAVRYGLDQGYRSFVLFGGLGGRLDHTIANLQVLTYLARQGTRGMLVNEATCCTVICSGTLCFEASEKGTISVFALDRKIQGVTIRGLQYTLENASVTNDFPLGVSNAFTGQESAITVREGAILVVWQRTVTLLCKGPNQGK